MILKVNFFIFKKMLYDFLFANQELLKVCYALLISFICAMIVLKTDRLFKISDYHGLRYIRDSFFFYGLAFIVRFILGEVNVTFPLIYGNITLFLFDFFILTGSFFLLYSLVWKKIGKEKNHNSLFNRNVNVIYFLSFLVAIFGILLNTRYLLFIAQIVLFSVMFLFSAKNLSKEGKKYTFLKVYSIAIILSIFVWILNILVLLFNLNAYFQVLFYFLEFIFFLIFVVGIKKFMGNKNG